MHSGGGETTTEDGPLFYGLCTLTALFCAVLLLRAYYRSPYKLLLWGGLCFSGLTLNNALLVADKIIFPEPEVNLITWRLLAALIAMLVFLRGLFSMLNEVILRI